MHSKAQLREAALSARSALGRDQRAAKSALIAAHLQAWQAYREARSLCFYASFGSEVQTAALLEQALRAVSLSAEGQGRGSPSGQAICLPRVEGDELVIHRIDDYLLREHERFSATDHPPQPLTGNPTAAGHSPKPADRPSQFTDTLPYSVNRLPQPVNHPSQPALDNSSAAASSASGVFAALVRSPMGMPEPPAALPVVPPQALELILVPGSAFCALSGHRIGYGKGFYDRLLARAPQALKVGLCFDVQLFAAEGFPFDPHDIALDALVSESGIRDLRGQKGQRA